MPINSLPYRFRQRLRAPAQAAYQWCTDFGPGDGDLFAERTERTVRALTDDALVMCDTTYSRGRPLRIHRLVRLRPTERSWTTTHLDGPYRNSQYWYRIVPLGRSSSALEFTGLRLERTRRPLTSAERKARADACRREDAQEWARQLAPALERSLRPG